MGYAPSQCSSRFYPNWVPWPTSKGSLEAEELDALNVMDLVHAAQLFGQILLRNIGHTWVATVGTQESTVAGDFLAFFGAPPRMSSLVLDLIAVAHPLGPTYGLSYLDGWD